MFPVFETETPVEPYPPPITKESRVATALPAVKAVAFGRDSVRLLIVAVPVAAPSVNVVAAPPIEREVALVLKRVAVAFDGDVSSGGDIPSCPSDIKVGEVEICR